VEDYIANGPAFENVLVSLIAEGVFQEFPGLKLVCAESGITWLPTLLWRTNKEWRGVRAEVPWIARAPADIIRDHVRFTIQPFDLPGGDAVNVQRISRDIGSDSVLLYASDYQHWHFDGEESLPDGLPDRLM